MSAVSEGILRQSRWGACQNYEQKPAYRIIAGVGSIRERVRHCQWIQSLFSSTNVVNSGYIMCMKY